MNKMMTEYFFLNLIKMKNIFHGTKKTNGMIIKKEGVHNLRSCVSKIYNSKWDITYDNYYRENLLYMDEIKHHVDSVLMLNNDRDYRNYINKFERVFATYYGIPYALGVSSGTTALSFALAALDVGKGDEVITTPHPYIGTVLSIINVGAKPVFVDINEDFMIDPEKLDDKITTRTKAVMPVHLYGYVCNMKPILNLAKKRNLFLVEDCCQAHGSFFHKKRVGTIGNVGCFSFHPSKIMGGLGDGGMIITAERSLAKKIRILREPVYNNPFVLKSLRTPARLDPIHIPFLLTKLKYLEKIVQRRGQIASMYNKSYQCIPQLKTPNVILGSEPSYRNYTLRAVDRDKLKRYFALHGIQAKIFYDVPLHLRKELQYLGYKKGDFPLCEKLYKEIISLPISHSLNDKEIEKIITVVEKYYDVKK